MRIRLIIAALILSAAAAAAPAAAQTPAAKEPPEIPRLATAPKIDGVLDNPLWETQALRIDAFVQLSPKENGVPTEKTVAFLGHDEKNLYVAFRAIVDYNFFYKEAFGSLLASWVLRPGTVFFLGFDNNYLRDELGLRLEPNASVFIKFSYWWRL